MANCNPRGGLLSHVYAKIEAEFGLEKEFTHHDFDEFLGKDKSKDRNRIGVRLIFLWKMGVLEKTGEKTTPPSGKKHGVYRAVRFPLSAVGATEYEGQGLNNRPKLDLDSLFFNLGRKSQNMVNIRKGDNNVTSNP